MIVVSDASPINYLIEIGHIDVLPLLFQRIIIPRTVAEELTAERAPQRNKQWLANAGEHFQIVAACHFDPSLDLDPGETEAICLAEELHSDALLIDEVEGRKVATRRGIQVFGTVGVLEFAAYRGHISLDETLEKLSQTRFFLAEKLRSEALERWRTWKVSQ